MTSPYGTLTSATSFTNKRFEKCDLRSFCLNGHCTCSAKGAPVARSDSSLPQRNHSGRGEFKSSSYGGFISSRTWEGPAATLGWSDGLARDVHVITIEI